MHFLLKPFYFLFLFFALCLPGKVFADEFQLWTELKYSHPFKDSPFTIFWATDNRFRTLDINHFFFNTTLGFNYQAYDWLSAGFAYRYQKVQQNEEDDFNDEQRLMPQVEFTRKMGKFKLKNRHLFELRILPDSDPDIRFRYRGRLLLIRKFPLKGWSVSPYVSEEAFVEPQNGWFNQNRVSVGNSFGFWKDKINFDLFYLYQLNIQPNGSVFNVQALGTSLGFKY